MILKKLGWNDFFENQYDKIDKTNLKPVRVTGVRKNSFIVSDLQNETLATVAGSLRHEAVKSGLFPVTGDWVLLNDVIITKVLKRKNVLSRGAAGTREATANGAVKEQVIAANIDTVFIVCGLDRDFNIRRIERYITLVYNSGAKPVIILTKSDLHENPDDYVEKTESIAFGIPVHPVSSLTLTGIDKLKVYLEHGQTIALVGSSGVGKSTLLNNLAEKQLREVREISTSIGKGVHTTTSRDLFILPGGGMIIDNPGIREIAFWDNENGIDSSFPEINKLSGLCRFSDCLHMHEPGCAVIQAVNSGTFSQERLNSYLKMKRELDYLADRQTKSADRIEKERWKDVSMFIKKQYKNK